MRKISLSELLRFGFEIRSTSYVYPKTRQIRKVYKIKRQMRDIETEDVKILCAVPRGYELWYDDEKDQPFIKKMLKKDPFSKLDEKRYPNQIVEEVIGYA